MTIHNNFLHRLLPNTPAGAQPHAAGAIPLNTPGTAAPLNAPTGLPTARTSAASAQPNAASTNLVRQREKKSLAALAAMRHKPREELNGMGVGVAQVTTSPHPFRSRTRTPVPKPSRSVIQAGQPAPTVPAALAAGNSSPAAVAGGTPAHVGPMQAALQSPGAAAASIDNCFAGNPVGEVAQLKLTVNNLKSAPSALTDAEATLLVLGLRRSFSSAVDAEAALRALTRTDVLASVTNQTAASTPEERAAWRFAADVEGVQGGVGLDLLSKITMRPAAAPGQPAPEAFGTEAVRGAVRAYLRAASQVADEAAAAGQAPPSLDPGSIYGHGNVRALIHAAPAGGWPGRGNLATPAAPRLTLAEKALLAVRDELDASLPAEARPHAFRFAVQLVRGDMLTDAPRNPDGTKSEFERVDSRARKTFDLHVRRATQRSGDKLEAFMEDARRGVTHHGKSPFLAYDHIMSARGMGTGFTVPNNGGIHEGRAMKDMAGVLQDAIGRSGGPNGLRLPTAAAPINASALQADIAAGGDTLRNLVRTALLETAQSEALFLPRLGRSDDVNGTGLAKARDAVLGRIAAGGAALPDGLDAQIDAALTAENGPLTPQRMMQWAADAGGPATPAAARAARAQAPAAGAVDWRPFALGFGRAAEGFVPPVDTPTMRNMTNQQVADLLSEMIRTEELCSGFSFSDMGNTHGTTKNASGIATGILAHGAGAVRLDAGGGLVHFVTFESGVSTDRSTLRMSVITAKRVQIGVGGTGGAVLGDTELAAVGVAASSDIGYSYDFISQTGTVFGFPRHLSGGVGGDRALAERKARLVQLLLDAQPSDGVPFSEPPNPEDRRSPVKRALHEFGADLSVGGFDVTQSEHRTTSSSSAFAGVTVAAGPSDGNFRAGLAPVSVAGQMKFTKIRYEDRSGSLKVVKETVADAFKVTGTGALATFNGLIDAGEQPPDAGWPDGEREVTGQVLLSSGNVAAGAVDFVRDGTSRATIRIMADGRELGTSFATTTFATNDGVVETLAPQLNQFASEKAEKYFPQRTASDRNEAVGKEKAAIGQLIGQARSERDMTGTTQLYWEFKDPVASNVLAAANDLTHSLGDTAAAALAKDELDSIHTDPSHRSARFVINLNGRSTAETKGLNGTLGMTHAKERRATEQHGTFT